MRPIPEPSQSSPLNAAGIDFPDELLARILDLVGSGQLVEAQKLILERLEERERELASEAARSESRERYEVMSYDAGCFYVVEHTPEGYIIPRGWTYPTEAMARAAIPYVAAGIHYPRIIDSPAAGADRFSFADPVPAERL